MIETNTPGPWTIKKSPSGNLFIYAPDRKEPVAGVAYLSGNGAATAALIAASPELLDALERVLREAEFLCPNTEWPFARAAIKKAKGEQP